jgi:serine/threonine protein kinase/tetratricopeptide (TPR) repeat protein
MAACRSCGAALDPDGSCVLCVLAGCLSEEIAAPADAGTDRALVASSAEGIEGDSFGPYRILRVLGMGGMGAVYLAEQVHPIQRQVALKVVKLGLNSSEVLSRFNYERQALARMDHPHISRVYDAGASEQGRPYFVMEYVDGLPITTWCDQHRLSTAERLELFIPVCQALHHAHQKGIIHRDIKPSNVLVTEVDGRPTPKVIDFGIARATEQSPADWAAFTQFGQLIGTPEYMSPEQADLVSGNVDTSSDVYSLGILLYELLIGAVPFDAAVLRQASLAELLRIVREEQAMPMTAKLTRMGDHRAGEVAGRRRTDPATLRGLVSGDLHWIVMKAIDKDRQRRYSAASEFAADIRRHADDQPVSASPPSATYRARKFVRRHKLPVAAAAAVVTALVGGLVVASWQATLARRERAEAVAARALAEQHSREAVAERNRAEQHRIIADRERSLAEQRLDDVHDLADSMLFEINDDVKDLAGGTKARKALVRLGHQYLVKETSALQGDARRSQALAAAFIKVGDLQGGPGSNLRDLAGARESYGRSVAMLEGEVAAHPRDAHLRHLLTIAYVRKASLEESVAAARAGFRKAEESAAAYAAQWPGELQGLRDRAEVLQAQGEGTAAVALRERVLASNPNDPVLRWELARAQLALGAAILPNDKPKALAWLQKGVDICAALSKEDPSNVQYQRDRAVALRDVARILQAMNRMDDAVAEARLSVSILQQLTNADRLNASFGLDLGDALIALSELLYRNGQVAEALEKVAAARAIQETEAAAHPDNADFPRQAAHYFRLAGKYKTELRDFEGAVAEYRQAEAIDRKLTARYPARFEFWEALRVDLGSVGDNLLAGGDQAAALAAYRDAFVIAKTAAANSGGEESMRGLADAHRGLAQVFAALSRLNEAITEQREVVAIGERQLAVKPQEIDRQRRLAFAYKELSMLHERKADFRAAVDASEKALRLVNAHYAARPTSQAARSERWNVLFHLLSQYPAVREYDRAVEAGRQMVEIAEVSPNLGPFWRDQFLSQSLRDLALTLFRCGQRDESLATFQRAISVLDRHPMETDPSRGYRARSANNYLFLAQFLLLSRQEEESLAIARRVAAVLEPMTREDPTNTLYRDTLLRAYRAAAVAALGMGDLAAALDFEHQVLQREPAPVSPLDFHQRALRLVRIGSIEVRLGHGEKGRRLWREALGILQRVAHDSHKQWAASRQNVRGLELAASSANTAAWILEELGDARQGLPLFDEVLREPGRGSEPAREGAARLQSLLDGDRADYRSYFENGSPTREQVLHLLANGWRRRAASLDLFGDSAVKAALRSVDLSRQLIAASNSAQNRLALAQGLITAGDALRAMARMSKGEESASAYRRSRDCYSEAQELLQSVPNPGKIESAGSYSLMALASFVADNGERLGSGTLSSK